MNSILTFIINMLHSLLHIFASCSGAEGEASRCKKEVIVSAPMQKGKTVGSKENTDDGSRKRRHRQTSITETTSKTLTIDTVSSGDSPGPSSPKSMAEETIRTLSK